MKKVFILFIFTLGWQSYTTAQQTPLFTKYIFNPIHYNPGYTGSAGALDMNLLHRQQWMGIEGAPTTQSFTIHSPINVKNIGIGFQASLDQIDVSRQFNAYASFAYRIPWGAAATEGHVNKGGGYISLGLQGGVSNWAADWTQLNLEDLNDPAFQEVQPNLWLPNFGTGIYVYTRNWYVGFSAPMLLNNSLRQPSAVSTQLPVAQQYRHYYLTGGGVIKLGPTMALRPSLQIKNVGLFMDRNKIDQSRVGAPTEFNVDMALLFNKVFWVGVSFRSAIEVFDGSSSNDSVDFWVSMRLKNGVRFGAAYDFPLTRLQGVSAGSYEVMLGYDLMRVVDKVEHVRYF